MRDVSMKILLSSLALFLEFMGVVIGAVLIGTALGYGLRSFHHERAAQFTYLSRGARFDDEFTFWIIRAAEERTKTSSSFYDLAAVEWALHSCTLFCLFFRTLFYIFTFWIIRARDEFSKTPFSFYKITAAIRTLLTGFFWTLHY